MVNDSGSSSIAVISGALNRVVEALSTVTQPVGITVDPSTGLVFVSCETGHSGVALLRP